LLVFLSIQGSSQKFEVRLLTEADVITYCQTRLTRVEFRAEMPKTDVGKILRRQLRDESQTIDTQAARSERGACKTRRNAIVRQNLDRFPTALRHLVRARMFSPTRG
jgi:hypothetical protein